MFRRSAGSLVCALLAVDSTRGLEYPWPYTGGGQSFKDVDHGNTAPIQTG
jgi:hypothetical protein